MSVSELDRCYKSGVAYTYFPREDREIRGLTFRLLNYKNPKRIQRLGRVELSIAESRKLEHQYPHALTVKYGDSQHESLIILKPCSDDLGFTVRPPCNS